MTSPYLLKPLRTYAEARADLKLAQLNRRGIVSHTLANATEKTIQDLRRKIRPTWDRRRTANAN